MTAKQRIVCSHNARDGWNVLTEGNPEQQFYLRAERMTYEHGDDRNGARPAGPMSTARLERPAAE